MHLLSWPCLRKLSEAQREKKMYKKSSNLNIHSIVILTNKYMYHYDIVCILAFLVMDCFQHLILVAVQISLYQRWIEDDYVPSTAQTIRGTFGNHLRGKRKFSLVPLSHCRSHSDISLSPKIIGLQTRQQRMTITITNTNFFGLRVEILIGMRNIALSSGDPSVTGRSAEALSFRRFIAVFSRIIIAFLARFVLYCM